MITHTLKGDAQSVSAKYFFGTVYMCTKANSTLNYNIAVEDVLLSKIEVQTFETYTYFHTYVYVLEVYYKKPNTLLLVSSERYH